MIESVSELQGKLIDRVVVYSNIVLLALADGNMVDIRVVDGEMRVEVRSKGPEGTPLGCRVYRSDHPYPKPIA